VAVVVDHIHYFPMVFLVVVLAVPMRVLVMVKDQTPLLVEHLLKPTVDLVVEVVKHLLLLQMDARVETVVLVLFSSPIQPDK
jgi:hypothetical protein